MVNSGNRGISDLSMNQAGVILVIILLFVVVGYLAPAMWALTTDKEDHVEVHEFSAQNAAPGDDHHFICIDKTASDGRTVEIFFELYTVSDNGKRFQVDTQSETRHLTEGRNTVVSSMPLDEELEEGTYQYRMILEVDLAGGRVTREFVYTSDPFEIQQGYERGARSEFFETCGSAD